MRKVLAVVFTFSLAVGLAAAASIVGSKHDLRQSGGGTPTGGGLVEVCVVCHTPHQTPTANGQYPLWNHEGTATATFGVYSSPTMNATPAEIGGAAMGSQSVSLLCMSCHDGTVSVLAMYNNPPAGAPTVVPLAGRIDASGRIISTANIGTNLTDDHPVNFTYDTALANADGGLVDPATSPTIQRWLVGGTVQCSSCHDVHDPQYTPFLRADNTGSALCLTCHIK